jgi:hypothetical protein
VAAYTLPNPLQVRTASGPSFWDKIGLGKKSNPSDPAALPARSLVEGLRNAGQWEAYLLHTPNASLVTVGSFDSPQDPRIQQMTASLVNWGRRPECQMLNLFAQPVPLPVPR